MATDNTRILVIRNDKLGDFMLAWPAFALLKATFPRATIIALVPEYTRPMAKACRWIDEIVVDVERKGPFTDAFRLASRLRRGRADAAISFFSDFRTALALWLAKVPQRVAPSTKIAQAFHNQLLHQRRSKSVKPEFEYNLDLARYYIELQGARPGRLPAPPYLRFDDYAIDESRERYRREHDLDAETPLVIIHPGSGGSAINLSVEQFAALSHRIASCCHCHFIITAGPGEQAIAEELAQKLSDLSHTVHASEGGIVAFARFLAITDLYISGSTGPLHIAGALNLPTLAFYPYKTSATALRWQTLNTADRRIAFSGNAGGMAHVDIDEAASAAAAVIAARPQWP